MLTQVLKKPILTPKQHLRDYQQARAHEPIASS